MRPSPAVAVLLSIDKFQEVVSFFVGNMLGGGIKRAVYRFLRNIIKIYCVYCTHTCFKAISGAARGGRIQDTQ